MHRDYNWLQYGRDAGAASSAEGICYGSSGQGTPSADFMRTASGQHASTSGCVPQQVELSMRLPLRRYTSAQFDRSMSFSAHGTESAGDGDDDSSCSSMSSTDSLITEAAPAQGAACSRSFEALQVEEGSTEVAFLRKALTKKDEECEHLRQIIKELSQSRAAAQRAKVELEENYVGLQKEYLRVCRVADLAREGARHHGGKAAALAKQVGGARDEAARAARHAAAARERACTLRRDNGELRRRLAAAEAAALRAGTLDDCRSSACVRELLFSHQLRLY